MVSRRERRFSTELLREDDHSLGVPSTSAFDATRTRMSADRFTRRRPAVSSQDPSRSLNSFAVLGVATGRYNCANKMIGKTISHYRIEEKLGEGGMGTVYRAHDLNLNRSVAVKFISAELGNAEHRRRFQLEAESASSLNHPNILSVYEAGSVDGQQYLVTEFIDGFTLREWVRREKPSVRQLLDVCTGIADGLACAHQHGILHRDIKPENILVSKQGYAKLVDFGLAKLLETEAGTAPPDMVTRRTRAGEILGTTAYMSPEQASGRTIDARSDIFSFGVVLYEILAGQRPFAGDSNVEILHAIINDSPPSLAKLRPETPYDLRVIVEKATEKDPSDRYQSMRDMVVDLKRFQRIKPADLALPLRDKKMSHAWRFYATAALVLPIAVFATIWYLDRAEFFWKNPLAYAQITRLTDFEGAEFDAAISADGKFVAFKSDHEGKSDAWVSQIGSGTFVNLSKGRLPEVLTDLNAVGFSGDGTQVWVWSGGFDASGRIKTGISLVPTLGGVARPFLPAGLSPAWSPDRNQIVYHSNAPGDPMFVSDPSGNNPKQIFVGEPGVHNHFPTWSPDSRFIYTIRGLPPDLMDIWRIPSGGGQPERITNHNAWVHYLAFLDRRRLLYTATAEDGSGPWLYSVDVDRRISHRVSFGLEQYLSIAASGDGRHLVATVANPSASLWTVPLSGHVATESEVTKFSVPTPRALAPRFGADYVLYLSSKGAGNGLWKSKDGAVTELSAGPVMGGAAVSPDGRLVCFAFRKENRLKLYLMNADGTEVRALAPSLDLRGTPWWSPDGKWIAVAAIQQDGSRLFKVPIDGGQPVRITQGVADSPVWSPDGSLIVYAEPVASGTYPIRAVTPEGTPRPLPDLVALRGGDRYRFLPNGKAIVLLLGDVRRQDFWLLDLATNQLRRITQMQQGYSTTGFDVSPDSKQIIFDRLQDNSDVVLITLPGA
jgi:serine/threonine protein kinase